MRLMIIYSTLMLILYMQSSRVVVNIGVELLIKGHKFHLSLRISA